MCQALDVPDIYAQAVLGGRVLEIEELRKIR